jgi:hypothetical protein
MTSLKRKKFHPVVDPKYGCVRIQSTCMTGLNVILKQVFYPMYNYKTAIYGPFKLSRTTLPDDMPKSGKLRGLMLDRHVNQMTYLCNKGVSLKLLISNIDPKSELQNKKIITQVRNFRRVCCGYLSQQMIPYLIDHHLTPIESQYPVADENVRVGTCIDLICKDSVGSYVILENKVGFESYYKRHSGFKMTSPFIYLEDCPEHQWFLYLTFAISMFQRQRDIKVNYDKCAVLRMTSNGLTVTHLPLWASVAHTLQLGWNMINHHQQTKKTRDKKKQKN